MATTGGSKRPARTPRRDVLPFDEAFDVLLEDTDLGVIVLDPRGDVAGINPAASRIFGVAGASARGTSGTELLRTVVPGDDPAREALRTARTEREVHLVTPDGGEAPVLLRSRRLGRPPWALVTLRDLTHMRRMQQELRRNERLATLGQLSAGVAHEIRNPLAGIGTSAQVLLRRFEPRDDRARFVRVILEEVARLDRIVTSLLQYARPRTPELAPSALAPCVERVLELSREPIEKAGVEVHLDIARRLEPVWIDADLVTQVVLNVTLNAVQAMPQGGSLRYEVRRVRRRRPDRSSGRRSNDPLRGRRHGSAARPDDGFAAFQQVRVIDTGAGIPRGIQAKLFHPFFTTKPRGTGLGLAISQTIMQEHGGFIEVSSREGRGTTVLLNFPVEKRHGERRHPNADPGRAHAAHRGRRADAALQPGGVGEG
jgi:two-component system sensor histidine kinase HydH